MQETYEYSKSKMRANARKRRLIEIRAVIPAIVIALFLVGLANDNPLAGIARDWILANWNVLLVVAMLIVVAVTGWMLDDDREQVDEGSAAKTAPEVITMKLRP